MEKKFNNEWHYTEVKVGTLTRNNNEGEWRNRGDLFFQFRSRVSDKFINEVSLAISKGVEVLDEKLPGWIEKIDLDTFDLGDASYCICGQLFADDWVSKVDQGIEDGYEYALRYVMEDWFHHAYPENGEDDGNAQASRLGFNLPKDTDAHDQNNMFMEWEYEWEMKPYFAPASPWRAMREFDKQTLNGLVVTTNAYPSRPYLWSAMTQMWQDKINEVKEARSAASV